MLYWLNRYYQQLISVVFLQGKRYFGNKFHQAQICVAHDGNRLQPTFVLLKTDLQYCVPFLIVGLTVDKIFA
jgi:hypothetical protein